MKASYSKMKDAKVDFFGKIPEHWEETRFGYLFSFGKGLNITKENLLDEGVPCINYGEIHSRYGFEVNPEINQLRCVSEDYLEEAPRCLLEFGDFIFADTSEDLGGSGNFAYYNSNVTAFAGYHTILNKPKNREHAPRYLAYLFDSRPFRSQIQKEVSGTKVFSITKSILKDVAVLLPSNQEQQSIVAYLDASAGKIDTAVTKLNQFLLLLQEKRTALISQVVTKGLPPEEAKKHGLPVSPKMKPSGVDWLGEIPEHWEVRPLKAVAARVIVGIAEAATHAYVDDGVPMVRATNVRPDRILLEDLLFIDPAFAARIPNKRLRKGDLLTVRTGNAGVTAVVPDSLDGAHCFTMLITTLKPAQNPDFFSFFLNSSPGKSQFQIEAWGTAQANISVPILSNTACPIPPRFEQDIIVTYLNKTLGEIDDLKSKVENAIELLKEYRSALITAAVTGKIDVREAAK